MDKLPPYCIKRLINDLKLIKNNPVEYIDALPDKTNPLKWHFIIQGPPYSIYKGGYYIGKIEYTSKYPYAPPNYTMLTPSGRFHINDKICITNSGYHTDQWSPSWTLRNTLLGFLSIMLDDTVHGLAHISGSSKQINANKRKLAHESVQYNKRNYLDIIKNFDKFFDENGNPKENINNIDAKNIKIIENSKPNDSDEVVKPIKEKKSKKSKKSRRSRRTKKEELKESNSSDEEIQLKRKTRKKNKELEQKPKKRVYSKRSSRIKIIEDMDNDKSSRKKLLLECMDTVDFTSAEECVKIYNLWKDGKV